MLDRHRCRLAVGRWSDQSTVGDVCAARVARSIIRWTCVLSAFVASSDACSNVEQSYFEFVCRLRNKKNRGQYDSEGHIKMAKAAAKKPAKKAAAKKGGAKKR